MRLAEQHQPGGWKTKTDPYDPVEAWPEDCMVQWGGSGVVLSKDGCYDTAFFEAFPRDPNTFIRGEGATVRDAEASAFRQFQRFQGCPQHEYERRGYTNGAGFCKHCGMFGSKVFEPTETCTDCGKKTFYHRKPDKSGWQCEDCAPSIEERYPHLFRTEPVTD